MNSFTFNAPSKLVFGAGQSRNLGRIASKLLGSSVLLITDPGVRRAGLCDSAVAALEQCGAEVTIFDAVEADPSLQTLLSALQVGREAGTTGVVGIGGGSSLDVAKLTALLLTGNDHLDDAWGVELARGPRLPLVLMPTTAGTGSEGTPVAIITVSQEEKRGISSHLLIPDVAVLDPELTFSLPPHVTAATGIDAMVHAIEAYSSKNANNNPLSRTLAKKALQLLGGNIEAAVRSGADAEARSNMLLGAMLAGQAFANSPVAAVHALAYPIGGTFHVPHGVANALVLPHVMRFNVPIAALDYADIAADAFPNLADVEASETRCEAFIDHLITLISKLGLPIRLRNVPIPKHALAKMASDAMKQQRLLVNNPREVGEAEALDIYRAAW